MEDFKWEVIVIIIGDCGGGGKKHFIMRLSLSWRHGVFPVTWEVNY
jgi:hypothetical protein